MKSPPKIAIIAAFAALYVIWGSTYLAIHFAIESIPPLLMAGTRYVLAGLVMYSIASVQGAPRSGWADWRTASIVGACLLLAGNGGVVVAQQYVASSLAALLVATVPMFISLLGWLTGSAPRPRAVVCLGLAGGFAGVGILIGPALKAGALGPNDHAGFGMLLLLFAAFSWSAGSLYSRTAKNARSPFLAAGQQMLCGGAFLIVAGFLSGEFPRFDPRMVTMLSLAAFAYLVVMGGIVGFTAYIWLLRHCHPAKVATYAYVNPVVAVLLGAAFAGETLTLRTAVAAGLIIGSVALVITAQQAKSEAVSVEALPQTDKA